MVKCRLCDSEDVTDLVFRQGVFRCNNCSALFRSYTFDYNWYSDVDYWYKGDEELKKYQKSFFVWFEDKILPGASIEFGGADGDFISLIKNMYPDQYIVYNELVDKMRDEYNKLGIEKFIGSFEEYLSYNDRNTFTNVFMLDVLEHLNDPLDALLQIYYTLLNRGGRVFIVTNNGDFLNAHNEVFYHQEHLCLFAEKSWKWIEGHTPYTIIQYLNNPQGLSFVVLEK